MLSLVFIKNNTCTRKLEWLSTIRDPRIVRIMKRYACVSECRGGGVSFSQAYPSDLKLAWAGP